MKNAITIKLLAFTLLAIIINACKKTDPDCDTCPCPACPRITEILPNHGRPGDTLILNGENFNEDRFLNTVTINDTLVQEILEGTTTQLKLWFPKVLPQDPLELKLMMTKH
ncbi:MAG: IPT/TIG domain-containing protein [Bacteroidetes bacterium]|nr:IPT/TIG domain-containing protein [Bacteroidota bacterium]